MAGRERFRRKKRMSFKKWILKKIEEPKIWNEYRYIFGGQILPEENEAAYQEFFFLNYSDIPSVVPLGVDTASVAPVHGALTSYEQAIYGYRKLLKGRCVFTIRNNGLTPCRLSYMVLQAKCNFGGSALSDWVDGVQSHGITSNETTDIQIGLKDGLYGLQDNWKLLRIRYKMLEPGQSWEGRIVVPMMKWDCLLYANEGKTTQAWITHAVIMRAQGVPSHDATTSTYVGTCGCHIDYTVQKNIIQSQQVEDLRWKKYRTTNDLSAQAAGGLVAVPDVEENKE